MIDNAINAALAGLLLTIMCGAAIAVILWLANQSRP